MVIENIVLVHCHNMYLVDTVACLYIRYINVVFFFNFRYYSATIIHMSGVKNDQTAILLSAVMAAINFIFNVFGLYLVERIGRRALTISSLIGMYIKVNIKDMNVLLG